MTYEEMLKNDREKIDIFGLSLNRKELEYNIYLLTHIANVDYAYIKYKDIIAKALEVDNIDDFSEALCDRVMKHDESKKSTQEYNAYRMKYFPVEGVEDQETENDEAFNKAWAHHYSHNDHHPEYWEGIIRTSSNNQASEMSDLAIAEMALDWVAMGMSRCNSKCYDYYKKVKDEIIMHDDSRAKFEKVLYAIEQYDIQLGDC